MHMYNMSTFSVFNKLTSDGNIGCVCCCIFKLSSFVYVVVFLNSSSFVYVVVFLNSSSFVYVVVFFNSSSFVYVVVFLNLSFFVYVVVFLNCLPLCMLLYF